MDIAVNQTFNIIDIINLAIGLAMVFAAVLSIYYMFSGGISLILSGGQDDKIKESVNTIRYAVIGLVITVLAFAFIFLLGNVFDVAISKYIQIDKIYAVLASLFDRVMNGPNTSGSEGIAL